jgi:hypothetical protein
MGKRVSVKFRANDLESRFAGAASDSGGISSGAHPEYEAETPGEAVARNVRKAVQFGRGVAAKIKTGFTGKK